MHVQHRMDMWDPKYQMRPHGQTEHVHKNTQGIRETTKCNIGEKNTTF